MNLVHRPRSGRCIHGSRGIAPCRVEGGEPSWGFRGETPLRFARTAPAQYRLTYLFVFSAVVLVLRRHTLHDTLPPDAFSTLWICLRAPMVTRPCFLFRVARPIL